MGGKQRWALMVLETLDTLGPRESSGAFEQTSGDLLAVNHGTLYPAPFEMGAGRIPQLATGLAASFANLAEPDPVDLCLRYVDAPGRDSWGVSGAGTASARERGLRYAARSDGGAAIRVSLGVRRRECL
jgi:hypothetical protein